MKNFLKILYNKYIQPPLLLTDEVKNIKQGIDWEEYMKECQNIQNKSLYEQDKFSEKYHERLMREEQWYFKKAWYERVKRIEGKHQIIINLYAFKEQWEKFYYPHSQYGYNHFYHLSMVDEYERTNSLVNRNGDTCILLKWEVRQWLLKNAGKGCYTVRPSYDSIAFGFDNSNVAMMFLLAWGME